MGLNKEISQLVKKKKKEIEKRENSEEKVFTLECPICKQKKVKIGLTDFENWDKDIFEHEHEHKIRKLIKKILGR